MGVDARGWVVPRNDGYDIDPTKAPRFLALQRVVQALIECGYDLTQVSVTHIRAEKTDTLKSG